MFLKFPPMMEEEEGGGGGKQASCLVAKQAVEFAQVLASPHNYTGLSIAVTGSKCPEHIHKS